MNLPEILIKVSPEAQAFIERFERLAAKIPTWNELDEEEESYPGKHDWYLCFAEGPAGGYRCICHYRGYGDWTDNNGNLVTVTHWQVLPAPPIRDTAKQ